MYNNPYIRNYTPNYNNFNQQNISDQIDYQINQLHQMKEQMRNQQPAINQTFQLAPTNSHGMKFVNTIDDVDKEIIYFDTPFFSKDMSVLWVKNTKGDIKTYELNEIIPKDDKDLQIELLMTQVEELKGMINNEQLNTNVNAEQITTNTTTDDETTRKPIETSKPTSIQRIQTSKKR